MATYRDKLKPWEIGASAGAQKRFLYTSGAHTVGDIDDTRQFFEIGEKLIRDVVVGGGEQTSCQWRLGHRTSRGWDEELRGVYVVKT